MTRTLSLTSQVRKAVAAARGNGFVYVITGGSDHCKIGVSRDPKRRLYGLRNAAMMQLDLYYSRKVAEPYAVEKEAHRIMRPIRSRGEWFKCRPLVARIAVDAACGDEDAAMVSDLVVRCSRMGELGNKDATAAFNELCAVNRAVAAEIDLASLRAVEFLKRRKALA